MYNTTVEGHEVCTVPMSLIVQLGSIVNFNVPMLETVFFGALAAQKGGNYAETL